MHIETYHTLPPEAVAIRENVFMKEQGFQDEFDAIDATATHLVLFDGNDAVGTCRFYSEGGVTLIGRIAIIKSHRGSHLGATLLEAAEAAIRNDGGTIVRLHAQCRARPFYEKQGYRAFGEIGLDEGCPHIWMEKVLGHSDHL